VGIFTIFKLNTMAKKKHLFSWQGFFDNECISAVIANAAPTDIVLTFSSMKPFTRAVAVEFTLTGTAKTIDSVTISLSAKTITIVVTVAYAFGNTCNVVFNPTLKGATVTKAVTNNVEE